MTFLCCLRAVCNVDGPLAGSVAIKREFGEHAEGFFVFNGTAANVLAIGGLIDRHEAVICADTAHLNVDECGAPERYLGAKLWRCQGWFNAW